MLNKIFVYINSLSMLQEHNATFYKKIRTKQKKKKMKPSILTLKNKKKCEIFVFTLLLFQAVYEKDSI